MPNWLLLLLPLIPVGVLLTYLFQRLQARSDEKRQLRKDGSEAVTPAKEFLARIGPNAIAMGTDEQNQAHLKESHEVWCKDVRPRLLVYANAHPSGAIRELAYQVADAVQSDMGATRYLLAMRNATRTMKEYEDAERAHSNAGRLVEKLLKRIRDY